MRFSTYLLLAVLAALVGHYPWLIDVAVGTVALALDQPAVLAAAAVGILVHKIRHWSIA